MTEVILFCLKMIVKIIEMLKSENRTTTKFIIDR
jgi:hypothetical protein